MQLKVDGRQVYAATGGRPFDADKPAIVFLHGAGMDHTVWQLPARSFAWHGHSVLAPDLPGHGRSDGPPLGSVAAMATWAANLLDAAGVRNAALVGHSMGGAIAVDAAGAMGPRISRVARCPARPLPFRASRPAGCSPRKGRYAYRMMTTWAFGARAKIGGNRRRPVDDGLGHGAVCAQCGGVLFADLITRLEDGSRCRAQVACPAGPARLADIMTPRNGRELAGMIASSRTVAIPDCGHMMMAEAPDAVLDALTGFFSQNAAAA
jgi:pimeloyl-ACP methyl ester carboxylesterase